MYPSGRWRGFWEQKGFGKQPMEAFELHFDDGRVTGGGVDVIGRFTFSGRYGLRTGEIRLVKQYVGKHRVEYDGHPDGEGCIGGTWTIRQSLMGQEFMTSGPFLLTPDLPRPTGDEPIYEIRK
ncbi:MAG: hypothetical protein U0871_19965 [Gemmataceae bacterium]